MKTSKLRYLESYYPERRKRKRLSGKIPKLKNRFSSQIYLKKRIHDIIWK